MSNRITLATQPRQGSGSRLARRERAEGRVPVIVYGHGEANIACTVSAHDLRLALETTAQVFTLTSDAGEEPCLVREVQYDTFGQDVLHVDFTRVNLSEQVHVVVALEFRGNPVGVSEGGTTVVHHPQIAVRCRADAIPDVIPVDVSDVAMGHGLPAGDVPMPEGVELDDAAMAPTEQVFAVAAPRAVEEEPEGEEGEAGEEAAGEGAAATDETKSDAPSEDGEG